MKHAQIFFGFAVLMFAATDALAKPAYVASTVNLRAAPGTKSEIVAKIPGGSLVDTKECSEGWCEITWQDKSGFAIQTALDMSGRVPRQAAAQPPAYARGTGPQYGTDEGYVVMDEPDYYAPPPGYYYRPYWGWRRPWW
jgi:uncharacterized protein YraI